MSLVKNDEGEKMPSPNQLQFFEKKSWGDRVVISADQVHGKNIVAGDKNSERLIQKCDGLLSNDPSVVLTVRGADCFPVFFDASQVGWVGLAHVGWKGATQNILASMLKKLGDEGVTQKNIKIIIGPGICGEHYSVSEERAGYFQDYPEAVVRRDGHIFLNIKTVIIQQLEEEGIVSITEMDECTYELPEKYFSYRRDQPLAIGTQIAYITLA